MCAFANKTPNPGWWLSMAKLCPVLLHDGPVLDCLVLLGEGGEEIHHLPTIHNLCRRSSAVLHGGVAVLHQQAHEPVSVQAAPRPHVVPQQ